MKKHKQRKVTTTATTHSFSADTTQGQFIRWLAGMVAEKLGFENPPHSLKVDNHSKAESKQTDK